MAQYPDTISWPPQWVEPHVLPNPEAPVWRPQENVSLADPLHTTHGGLNVEYQALMGLAPGVHVSSSANRGSSNMQGGGVAPANQRADYTPKECLDDIRKVCKDAQSRISALGNAIGRQPGVPSSLIDMVNTDLRHVAQQFVHTCFYVRKLETKLEELDDLSSKDRANVLGAHALEINSYRRKCQAAAEHIAKVEEQLHDSEAGYGNADKRRKVELEKKTEKINNQKRRIKEQQDQIEKLKDKYVNPGKPGFRASRTTSRAYDDSSSELEFPHSATSEMGYHNSPPLAPPRYTSTLDERDEEYLLKKLQKIGVSSAPTRQVHTVPPQNSYNPYVQPMNPMNGAIAPYGYPPQMAAYGAQMIPDYGHGGLNNGQMPVYPGYGVTNYQAPPVQQHHLQSRNLSRNDNGRVSRNDNGRVSRGPESQLPSNALVLRRNDDSDLDPETKVWKDMFVRLFTSSHGWAETYCAQIIPGVVEDVTSKNAQLWEYILKVATCYKDPQAAPKHALFMLNSPVHRGHFISRMLMQYVQQEIFTYKFWLGWDDETDIKLNTLGPIVEAPGHSLDTRRDARQQVRRIIEEIVKDEDYVRFKKYKQTHHVNRMKDIGGLFVNADGNSKDAVIGLHSLANSAMEISMKMMTSRLTFTFTWNECAVKFSHESHIALNSDAHGISLQHKHTRVGLVVTPSISYRDDTGRSIVPRGVAKAQVLIMN